MKRWFAITAVGMILLYAALGIGAVGCVYLQPAGSEHAHQTPSHASHSPLCAWACQANPLEVIHTAIPPVIGLVCVAMQSQVYTEPQALLLSTVSRTRAPPV